jgi:DNA integrity scanning protein DisA with diadenylate cyclase activity
MLMLKLLMESAARMARELGIEVVAVVSKTDIGEFGKSLDNIKVIQIPKKYATLLDSMIHYLEESPERSIAEKFSYIHRTREYISTMLSLRGLEFEKAVVVIDTDMLKGITILGSEMGGISRAVQECSDRVSPEAFKSVLTVALNIANRGREGKKIGTAFVMGDVEEVLKRSAQIILNPYEGHDENDRDIKNPETWESVMEFAQLDGVFVVDENGIIIAAGRYIEASPKELGERGKMGLGGRHIACASITKETKAVAIVVSESGGDITVYKDGVEILHIPSILF